jgi:hypothetical protein
MLNANRDEPSKQRPKSLSIAMGLLFVSVTLNIVSARRISTPRQQSESQRTVLVGETVPDIVALDPTGSPVTLRYAEVNIPTILSMCSPRSAAGVRKTSPTFIRSLIKQGLATALLGLR